MKKQIVLIFLVLFSISCSRLEVAYKFADNYAASKADDFFDLTNQQKKEFKTSIRQDLDKARLELFPEMAQKLRELEEQTNHPVTRQVLEEDIKTAESMLWKFAGYYKNTALQTVKKLTPQQFKEFDKEAGKSIAENRSHQKASDKLRKRYRRNAELWLGGINNDQKRQIEKFISQHPFPFELQAQNREHLLMQFKQARTEPQRLEMFLHQYFDSYDALRLPAYAMALDQYQSSLLDFVLKDFWPTLTDRQKQTLKENLKNRADQLQKLADKKN